MFPNFNLMIWEAWGQGFELPDYLCGGFSNLTFGTNPPYTSTDFLAMYPNFGGFSSLTLTGTLAVDSPIVTGASTTGLQVGAAVSGTGIPALTTILSVDSPSQFTLTQNATATGAQTITVSGNPFVPLAVINAYIALASASLQQARWLDTWKIGMGLFVAHFVTLWLRAAGNAATSAGQVAAAGLKTGIGVSASAGGQSQSLQPVTGIEQWAAWQTTGFGTLFATHAEVIGAGPAFIW